LFYRLKINSKTWKKDSYELIDYDSDQINSNSMEIHQEGYIYRNDKNIEFSTTKRSNDISEKLLEIIKIQNGVQLKLNEYEIDENENIITPNSTWFLFRKIFMDERMNDYNLKEGDILKIGRISIRIKSIRFKKSLDKNKTIDLNQSSNSKKVQNDKIVIKTKKTNETEANKACRICYMDEEQEDNPLIQPCICSGSMKYIHLQCLKKWLSSKVFVKIETSPIYNIYLCRKAECELCKTKFPDFIKHKGILYEIFDFYNDFDNYLIIESLTLDKNQNKYIYVINLDIENNRINIGRGHESHIILHDISVSRLHCIININKKMKKINITDNNSKFGTLILVQTKNIVLSLDLKLHIQIGRSYMEFLLKGSSNFFDCCGIGEKKNYDYYYNQNKDKILSNNNLSIKNENENDIDCMNIIKKNEDSINKKINDLHYLKTNPNITDDNIEELLNFPLKTKNDENEMKKEIKTKNMNEDKEESIVISDNSINNEINNQNLININDKNQNENQKENENQNQKEKQKEEDNINDVIDIKDLDDFY
jgi:hypothetical protein